MSMSQPEAMVERARLAGERWFSQHPDGASTDDEWRDHYRTVLEAALQDVIEALDAIDAYAGRELDHELHAIVDHYRRVLLGVC